MQRGEQDQELALDADGDSTARCSRSTPVVVLSMACRPGREALVVALTDTPRLAGVGGARSRPATGTSHASASGRVMMAALRYGGRDPSDHRGDDDRLAVDEVRVGPVRRRDQVRL
jgi:hypothetical protein